MLPTEDNILTHTIDGSSSLFEEASELTLSNLENFVAQALQQETAKGAKNAKVLLIQKGGYSDFTAECLQAVSQEALFLKLWQRILRLRLLFKRIRTSNLQWIYACDQDCLGTLFELALCCDRRISFNTRCQVGLPVITANLFPIFAGFEKFLNLQIRSKKQWSANPILSIREAVRLKIFDFVADSDDWFSDAKNWVMNRVLPHEKTEQENQSKDKKLGWDIPDFSALADLEIYWAKIYASYELHSINFWEYGFGLINPKQKSSANENPDIALSYFFARSLLSSTFLSWFKKYVIYKTQRVDPRGIEKLIIYIDLNHLLPATDQVLMLLETANPIIFYSGSGSLLSDLLNLIYARCVAEAHDINNFKLLWLKHVGWFVGPLENLRSGLLVRWLLDDTVLIQSKNSKLELGRINTNRIDAPGGWAEVLTEDTRLSGVEPQVVNLGRILFEGLVINRGKGKRINRLSLALRSGFFDQLIKFSRGYPGGIEKILQILHTEGWRLITDEAFWDHFLRNRKFLVDFETKDLQELGFPVSEAAWEIHVWKDALNYCLPKKERKSDAEVISNPVLISQHFAFCCVMLWQTLLKSKLVDEVNVSDILTCEALGFPASYGCIQIFLEERGLQRFEHYRKNSLL